MVEFNLDQTEGEWFQFFGSRIDLNTGEIIYEEPTSDARVQIRSLTPFLEERIGRMKRTVEHIHNPKTRTMERLSYFPDQTFEEAKRDREDAWDYAIIAIENFKDSKTGEFIVCTRENKLKLMRLPVFDRFLARCQQMLADSGIKEKEEEKKT